MSKRSPKTNLPAGRNDGGGSAQIILGSRVGRQGKIDHGTPGDKQSAAKQRSRKIAAWCEGRGLLPKED